MADFHKIWIDQCEATEDIREQHGIESAIGYLVGEKLMNFIQAGDTNAEFAAELPLFVTQIKEIFQSYEITAFFDQLAEDSAVDRDADWVFDSLEDAEFEPEDLVEEAQKILLIERAKELLS